MLINKLFKSFCWASNGEIRSSLGSLSHYQYFNQEFLRQENKTFLQSNYQSFKKAEIKLHITNNRTFYFNKIFISFKIFIVWEGPKMKAFIN